MSAASFQELPSNTSVCGTIFLSFCPPTTTSLSPTTAAAGRRPERGRGLVSRTQLPPRNANTLFDACAMLSVAPPITTTSPRYVAAVAWCSGIGNGGLRLPGPGLRVVALDGLQCVSRVADRPATRSCRRARSTPSSAARSAHPAGCATATPVAVLRGASVTASADEVT